MPRFVYTDTEVREYNDFGLIKEGDEAEAAKAPDYRWKPLDDAPLLMAEEG